MKQLIDTHCHLADDKFVSIEKDFFINGETQVRAITIGTNIKESQKAIQITKENPEVKAIVGIHPDKIDSKEGQIKDLEELIKNNQEHIVGVGECGFDFFRKEKSINLITKQKEVFWQQLELAQEYNLPLMLHVRSSSGSYDAYEYCLDVLREYQTENKHRLRGNVHFFAADSDIAQQFLDLGFDISFTGVIT